MRDEIATVFGVLGACFLSLAALPALAQPLVVLDPGHGGSDPGAVGCGLEEDNGVLDVSLRLRTLLEAAGVRVTMTRETDTSVGLSARAALANSMGADVFVSNHSNSNAGAPASGTETWVATAASARSVTLAGLLQDEMVATWGLPDRGVKYANFVVVRDTTMPAALAELAFTNRCTPDAALLGSPTARQDIAEAEARAILAWLGIMPGTDGTLRGVVFEDQGVGVEDLTVRLPGATVTLVESGASATADSPDANWSFMVPAGTFTIEASAPGHITARQTCMVSGAATTWCSIGLFPNVVDLDAGASDAGTGADSGASDAGAATDASSSEVDAGAMRETTSSCGCRVQPRVGSRGFAFAAFGLLMALVWRRRRLGLAALLLLGACGAPGEAARPALTAPHVVNASFAHLDAVQVLSLENVEGPVLSPDGRYLLLPRSDFASLDVLDLEGGERRTIVTGERVGYAPRWQNDGSVAVRGPGESPTAIPGRAFTLDGQATAVLLRSRAVHAWVEPGEGEDAVRFRDGHTTRTLSSGGDRYLMPQVSSDGLWVSYWGVGTGVFVYRVDVAERTALGDPLLQEGDFGHPSFDPSGRCLAFEHTTDEGHVFTSGSIRIADLQSAPIRWMTLTDETVIARQPTLSGIEQGRGRIAFLIEGGVVVADLTID